MAQCPQCQRDFPVELIQPLITKTGRRMLCPLCALEQRNLAAGLPPDAPFAGTKARELHAAALAHVMAQEKAPKGKP